MIDRFVRRYVWKYVNKGNKDFIIYPYGSVGIEVKQILEECFGIIPRYIVDVECSSYREDIITFDELKEIYNPEMFILLTMEKKSINEIMMNNLLTFVPEENIGNILNEGVQKSKFELKSFLPSREVICQEEIVKLSGENNRLKLRVLYLAKGFLNSIKTFCEACKLDEEIELLLIINKDTETEIIALGCNYIGENDYQIETDKPDILLLASSSLSIQDAVRKNRRIVGIIAVLSLNLVEYSSYTMKTAAIDCFEKYFPDYYLADSYLYRYHKDSWITDGGKLIECGNPKYDDIYIASQNKRKYIAEKKWKKLKDKKVVLWAPTHGVEKVKNSFWEDMCQVNATAFDLYAKTIFEYMDQNEDVALIFRPHPLFIKELLSAKIWNEEDYEYFKQYCEKSKNIVLDESKNYDAAYSISDAIITDLNCGIVASAFPMLKPIGILYRNKNDLDLNGEITKSCYHIYSEEEMFDFLSMIKMDQDEKFAERQEKANDYIMYFDGKNGQRLKELLKESYINKVSKGIL